MNIQCVIESLKVRRALANLRDGKCRAPLFFKNIKTNTSIAVDIRVEDLSPKSNLRMKYN